MTATRIEPDTAGWIENVIKAYCGSSANTLQDAANEPAWAEALLGYSRGDDPLYEAYKEYVGEYHLTPLELYSQTYPDAPADAGELSVISWILPQTAATKADNQLETQYPAERWARSRIFGEEFNSKLRQHLVGRLREAGVKAVAPALSPLFESKSSERYVFASTWSERHAAHASGLGTFGLCDGLITPVGKAVRIGSVIARMQVPVTPRPYSDHRAYCLFYSQGICGDCIERCPVGALSKDGHDKVLCRAHLRPTTSDYVKVHYNFDGYGCGLCQTGVPCESKIPTADEIPSSSWFLCSDFPNPKTE
jgi:epoxyqueuosine reductase